MNKIIEDYISRISLENVEQARIYIQNHIQQNFLTPILQQDLQILYESINTENALNVLNQSKHIVTHAVRTSATNDFFRCTKSSLIGFTGCAIIFLVLNYSSQKLQYYPRIVAIIEPVKNVCKATTICSAVMTGFIASAYFLSHFQF